MTSHRAQRVLPALLPALLLVFAPFGQLRAQDAAPARTQLLALADSALAAITRGDWVGFTDLMIPEAVLFPTRDVNGAPTYLARSREAQRTAPNTAKITERGYDGEARIAGRTATVWLPYDLYVNDTWSHCGVDTFLMVQTPAGWRIASMAWSVEQPPACRKHPAGPPPLAR